MTTGQVPLSVTFDEASNAMLGLAKAFGTFGGTYTIAGQTVTVSNCTVGKRPGIQDRHTWVLVQLECGHAAWRIADYPMRSVPVERDLTGLCPGCKAFGEHYVNGGLYRWAPPWTDTMVSGKPWGMDDWFAWKVELPP